MIRHIVMYRLNDPTTENKQALVDKFMSMNGNIPCLIDIEAGVDKLGSERSFDVCLLCTFDSMDKLEEYREHPFHQGIVAYVRGVVKQSHCVDYEIGE